MVNMDEIASFRVMNMIEGGQIPFRWFRRQPLDTANGEAVRLSVSSEQGIGCRKKRNQASGHGSMAETWFLLGLVMS